MKDNFIYPDIAVLISNPFQTKTQKQQYENTNIKDKRVQKINKTFFILFTHDHIILSLLPE